MTDTATLAHMDEATWNTLSPRHQHEIIDALEAMTAARVQMNKLLRTKLARLRWALLKSDLISRPLGRDGVRRPRTRGAGRPARRSTCSSSSSDDSGEPEPAIALASRSATSDDLPHLAAASRGVA